MNNKKNRLTLSIITAVFMLACACPATGLPAINAQPTSNIPTVVIPTQMGLPTAAPQPPSNLLLSETFDASSDEMESFSDESGSAEMKGGAYVVRSTGDLWNWGRSQSEFANAVFEFDTVMVIGPANNNAGMGVICRMRTRDDDSIDGYLLAISGDGYYSIRSISAGSMSPLVDWTFSDSVKQGAGGNKIRATCNNTELKLEVNGKLLATANTTPEGPPTGRFAFTVVSFETNEPTAEIHFDNLLVSNP